MVTRTLVTSVSLEMVSLNFEIRGLSSWSSVVAKLILILLGGHLGDYEMVAVRHALHSGRRLISCIIHTTAHVFLVYGFTNSPLENAYSSHVVDLAKAGKEVFMSLEQDYYQWIE